MFITRDTVRAVYTALKQEQMEIPEWGGTVFVREMTGAERSSVENRFIGKDKSMDGMRESVIMMCTFDDTGGKVFHPGDEKWLCDASADVLDRMFGKIMDMSGMGKEAAALAEKNSGTALTS